jgi:uncharacterized protein YjbI with pentapeptide repeats
MKAEHSQQEDVYQHKDILGYLWHKLPPQGRSAIMFLRPAIAIVVIAVLIYGLWMLLNGYFAPHKAAGKRELIQSMALIVGGVVAFGTLFVSYRNLRHSQETALSAQQNTQDALEEQRELDEGRRQDEALQTYLGQMSQLLTDKNLRGRRHWLDDARVTARVQTFTALRRLSGGARKGSVLQLLYEAQLINKDKVPLTGEEAKELGLDGPTEFDDRIVGLSGADLTSADLTYITLSNAALNGAFLDNADLRNAKLNGVDLGGAYLSGADLRDAKLSDASLVNAQLQRKDEFSLHGADLSGADLSGADLSGADLRSAALSGAIGVTAQQLGMCKALAGATMPNGQKYEDWLEDKKVINCLRDYNFPLVVKKLKYKEGRGENGEDSSAS